MEIGTRVWGSPFTRDLCPISLHDIHYSYLSYCGRATSCTQVSFNSRPELIIESYELYISTSEPTSARNSNEESPVAAVDEILTHCSLSLAWYETAMMERKVVYRLQKYSWKEHLTTVQDISVEICNLQLGVQGLMMVCLWLCMCNQISPANRTQGYKIDTKSFLSITRGWPQKQTSKRKNTHAQLTRLCTLWHWNEERSIEIRYTRLPGPWGLFCTSETGLPPRTRCLGKLHRRIKLTSHEHKTWLPLECLHTSTPDLYINKKQTWLKLMDKRRTEQVYIL